MYFHCFLLVIFHWFNSISCEDDRFTWPLKKVSFLFDSEIVMTLDSLWVSYCQKKKKYVHEILQAEISAFENPLERRWPVITTFIHSPSKNSLDWGQVISTSDQEDMIAMPYKSVQQIYSKDQKMLPKDNPNRNCKLLIDWPLKIKFSAK